MMQIQSIYQLFILYSQTLLFHLFLELYRHDLTSLCLLVSCLLRRELEDRRISLRACNVWQITILLDRALSHLVLEQDLSA